MKKMLSFVLMLLFVPVLSFAAPKARTETPIEKLEGREALAHLRNLKSRRVQAFAAAEARMREKGFKPTDIVEVVRSTSQVRKGISGQKSSPFHRVEDTFTSEEGELVFWSFDDGDDATWEGVIYVENYSTGAYATYDAQLDVSVDEFYPYWEENTYYYGGGGGGGGTAIAPVVTGSNEKEPVAKIASAGGVTRAILDANNAGGGVQQVQYSFSVRSWLRCSMTNCVGVMAGCRWTGPAALKCTAIGCTAVAIACGLAELL